MFDEETCLSLFYVSCIETTVTGLHRVISRLFNLTIALAKCPWGLGEVSSGEVSSYHYFRAYTCHQCQL